MALGRDVTLHARSSARADDALAAVPGAAGVVVGDLSSVDGTMAIGGTYDVVVHNAGVLDGPMLEVNVLAPYVLTCLLPRPQRLVYLSSTMHRSGTIRFDGASYGDTKLLDIVLAFAVARRWPGVSSNAVDPGWVRSKMGGGGAPDSLADGASLQVELATSDDPPTGRYLSRRGDTPHVAALDVDVQEQVLAELARRSGVPFPD